MIKRILGMDLSSSTCGYAALTIDTVSKEIKFVSVNYIKPVKDGTIIERLADTRDKIKSIIEEIKPHFISIEDILMYLPGKSSANTIITLATFNRAISLVAFDYLGHTPNMYGVIAIRNALKPAEVFPMKEDMPKLVAWHLNIDFPYEYNKKGKIKDESMDKSDAISAALMHAFAIGGKTNPKGPAPKMTPKPPRVKKLRKTKKKKVKKNEYKRSIQKA